MFIGFTNYHINQKKLKFQHAWVLRVERVKVYPKSVIHHTLISIQFSFHSRKISALQMREADRRMTWFF